MNLRRTATISGLLWIATFVTSIPAYFTYYAPFRTIPSLITGTGPDPTHSVAMGVVLELLLIIANVATALMFYPILKRQSQAGALGFVCSRIMESTFIAIGLLSALVFLFMRQQATGTVEIGRLLVAIYDRAFLLGPGFIVGVGNGLLLGWLMFQSQLVPRWMSILGLIGGPLLIISAVAIMFGATERGGSLQALSTIPEFLWELLLGIYLVVKGFRPSRITAGMD